ncbi:hypothetical protein PILCRDRAFT_15014 [Piloderma croceum F 1598]|uniref:Uncharacterized protein n=1 Tax=Piloderma croceum (strain F 1598) TaxID=765440 RepID=A0A0C3F1B8_PILCF|nr:hypothetical protein PILCRDRAFT_15014 [Piloderma croceum F 1598]
MSRYGFKGADDDAKEALGALKFAFLVLELPEDVTRLLSIKLTGRALVGLDVTHYLAPLDDKLLDQNLLCIVEPYSVVEIEYVNQQADQPSIPKPTLSSLTATTRFVIVLNYLLDIPSDGLSAGASSLGQ